MRRFRPPWTIEEANDACFIVRDKNRQALGYFYFEDEPGRRSEEKLPTRDEARRMASNFAKLPRCGCRNRRPIVASQHTALRITQDNEPIRILPGGGQHRAGHRRPVFVP